ncbi:MAG: hypothetical protein MUC29_01890 [Pyrinomonadaceae bacterium]|nr:hypothetical protein [Pyrinomonadaceae bacterium]
MTQKTFVIIFLVVILFGLNLSCRNQNDEKVLLQSVNEPIDLISEEYAVYETLLKDRENNFFVVIGEPIDEILGVNRDFFKEEFPKIQEDTLTSYIERSNLPIEINKTPDTFKFTVINKIGNEKKLENESRYFEFTKVGFSNNGKQAFVYFSNVCNALCGKGAYYLLSKENGIWKIVEESETWRS